MAGHMTRTEKNIHSTERDMRRQFSIRTHAKTVLQCSKVKRDVRMLLATASSFLDSDDGVLMMTTMTTSTRKTARTHTVPCKCSRACVHVFVRAYTTRSSIHFGSDTHVCLFVCVFVLTALYSNGRKEMKKTAEEEKTACAIFPLLANGTDGIGKSYMDDDSFVHSTVHVQCTHSNPNAHTSTAHAHIHMCCIHHVPTISLCVCMCMWWCVVRIFWNVLSINGDGKITRLTFHRFESNERHIFESQTVAFLCPNSKFFSK